jgi:hypothetical protein
VKVFVAVGTQLAFDRLVRTVDAWAADHPEIDVFAQVGPGAYEPVAMQSEAFLPLREFDERSHAADLLVTHAGTGCILTALELKKPIVVMPRRAVATAFASCCVRCGFRGSARFYARGRPCRVAPAHRPMPVLAALRPADMLRDRSRP